MTHPTTQPDVSSYFCYEKDWASDFQSLEKVNTIHYEDVK